MSYQIIITQNRAVKTFAGKEWKVIGTKEVECNPVFEGQPKTRITEEYGFTPEVEKTQMREVEVLKQTVDDLDLAAVIKAINKL